MCCALYKLFQGDLPVASKIPWKIYDGYIYKSISGIIKISPTCQMIQMRASRFYDKLRHLLLVLLFLLLVLLRFYPPLNC